jgi:hypothetical protein
MLMLKFLLTHNRQLASLPVNLLSLTYRIWLSGSPCKRQWNIHLAKGSGIFTLQKAVECSLPASPGKNTRQWNVLYKWQTARSQEHKQPSPSASMAATCRGHCSAAPRGPQPHLAFLAISVCKPHLSAKCVNCRHIQPPETRCLCTSICVGVASHVFNCAEVTISMYLTETCDNMRSSNNHLLGVFLIQVWWEGLWNSRGKSWLSTDVVLHLLTDLRHVNQRVWTNLPRWFMT